jgi:hypothetical protein
MGGSSSKKQLYKSITNVTTSVVVKFSSSNRDSIKAPQSHIIRCSYPYINILKNSKISLDLMQITDVNASMQTAIVNNILSEVSKNKTNAPQIAADNSDTEITNIVENNVSSSFSIESLSRLSTSIELDQSITFLKGSKYNDFKVTQTAEAVGKLINDMSTRIVNQLATSTIPVTKNVVSPLFVADLIDSVGDASSDVIDSTIDAFAIGISSVGSVFCIDGTTVIAIFIMMIIGVIMGHFCLGGTMVSTGSPSNKRVSSKSRMTTPQYLAHGAQNGVPYASNPLSAPIY